MVAIGLITGLGACATEAPQKDTQAGVAAPALIPALPAQAPAAAIPARLTTANAVSYMDGLQKAIEKALAAHGSQGLLELERQADNGVKLTASNEVSFDFNRSEVKQEFSATLTPVVLLPCQADDTANW